MMERMSQVRAISVPSGQGLSSRHRWRPSPPPAWLRRVTLASAGPLAIVGGVLAVLHSIAFSGMISNQYPDVLPFWLPTYCFLGKSLAAGHIPAWNPHVMGGVPFAADPQSGWLYLPAMLLFTTLSCGRAIRWFIVAQPLLAGLGLYAFLRAERLSRPAATAGGLVLAMLLAGSFTALNLPFAGTMAWTAILLAVAARYLHAERWPGRLGWLAAVAVAWGQVAAANLSDGVAIATAALVVYVVAKLSAEVHARRRSARLALGTGVLLFVPLIPVNLAILLPHLAYLPRTSLSLGYQGLERMSQHLTGHRTSGLVFGTGTGPLWPLRLALTPGVYLGAVALGLTFAGWRARRFRHIAVAFAVYGGACYVAMLQAVSTRFTQTLRHLPLGQLYLHDPSRFRFGLLIALAVLAGVGVEAWRQSRSWLERALLIAPGVIVWGVLPWSFHVGSVTGILLLGALAAGMALAASAWRPGLVFLVPVVLLVELSANGLGGQSLSYQPAPLEAEQMPIYGPINTLTAPDTRMGAYMDVGSSPIVQTLRTQDRGRYLTLFPGGWDPRGYHVRQGRVSWPLLGMQQSMLFGLQEAQGYNPTQLLRFWTFVRAMDPKSIRYNAGFFTHASPLVLNLMDVNWALAPANRDAPVTGAVKSVVHQPWALYRLPTSVSRVSVLPAWDRVASDDEALAAIRSPGFDPDHEAVVEGPLAESSGAGPGSSHAIYRPLGPQAAEVTVDTTGAAIVLIRNSFDPQWHATVDGRTSPVLATDYLLQGVAVGPGHHTIRLSYDDPTAGYGLLGSGLALLALLGTIAYLAMRARRRSDSRGAPR
jgi:hypothetical protein